MSRKCQKGTSSGYHQPEQEYANNLWLMLPERC